MCVWAELGEKMLPYFHYLMSIRFESLNRSIRSSVLTSFVKGSFCDESRTEMSIFLLSCTIFSQVRQAALSVAFRFGLQLPIVCLLSYSLFSLTAKIFF